MNVIGNKLRSVSVIISTALQQSNTRGYAAVKKLPVEWVRPVAPSCTSKEKSGDLGLDFNVKPEDTIFKYENSKELENIDDELVKKMVSVEFNRGRDSTKLEIEKAINMSKRHILDRTSMEVQFGIMTARILKFQEILEKFPYNKRIKVICKELIEKRQKSLKKLRERDYACFEYILERFNIVFHPAVRPEHYHRVEKNGVQKLYYKNISIS